MEPIEPTECPYYLLTRASLAITAHLKRALAEAGVGSVRPAYLVVLVVLWQHDGLKVVELGRRAGLEPSTMTGLLDRMERDNLVRREADPADRRVLRVQLTDEGRQMREAVMKVLDHTISGAMKNVSELELVGFKQTLRQILADAHKLDAP